MKLTMIISLLFGSLIFSTVIASEEKKEITEDKKEKQSTEKKEKKRRRKKALMCDECGKPEVECDCEGHGQQK